jgi:hypothetical protein
LIGRDAELARLTACLEEGVPVRVYGPPGSGKSALLRRMAADRAASGTDVIYLSAAGLTVEDVVQELFQACYDAEDYRPQPARLRRLMASIHALFVIDDFAGSTEDLRMLLDASPASDMIVASAERSMWSEGRAFEVAGLNEGPALALLEHELGRPLTGDDTEQASRLWQASHGHPRILLQAAAAVRTAAGGSLATDPHVLTQALVAGLGADARTALAVLRALDGVVVTSNLLIALTGITAGADALDEVRRARLAEPAGSGFVLATTPAVVLPDADRRPLGAADFARPMAGWIRTRPAREVTAVAPAVVRVLTAAVDRGDLAGALELARAAAPALGRTLRWGAWSLVLALGQQAAHQLGAADDEAYFAHEDDVLRRALGLVVGLAVGTTVGAATTAGHAAPAHTTAKPSIAAVATHPAVIAAGTAVAVATGVLGVTLANGHKEPRAAVVSEPALPQAPLVSLPSATTVQSPSPSPSPTPRPVTHTIPAPIADTSPSHSHSTSPPPVEVTPAGALSSGLLAIWTP